MDARTILAKLRTGDRLNPAEIGWFAEGLASGAVDDAQAGAFAMAVCCHPMSEDERVALTLAMRDSGDVMTWDLPGPVVDKHSTGGIGDCISLTLGPAMAALGAYMPMLSGRGLGHTGGTLDKLESIPGLSTELGEEAFRRIVRDAGCALVAASGNIAPADRRLYAIRDVTSTVESIDLITASILSKKLAGGAAPLMLDVKAGSGAFMRTLDDAGALAASLVQTAQGAGSPASALITDMNQPCVPSVGNALEIMEVMVSLTEDGTDTILSLLTAELGGELLRLAGMAETRAQGAAQVQEVLSSGAAAERFGRMVAAKGGPRDFVERWRDRLPAAPVERPVPAPRAGFVAAMDGYEMGMTVVRLGGGRMRAGERIDPSVGLSDVAMLGDEVAAGDVLAVVHAADEDAADAAVAALVPAFEIGETEVEPPPLVHRVVT
ncbi:MAG: thymidine phosphorylase [Rhodobacter sp.]|nr:thymidine phosphorylase [Rhodobacter sp.]